MAKKNLTVPVDFDTTNSRDKLTELRDPAVQTRKEVELLGPKPGWKTTEFWLLLVSTTITFFASLGLLGPEIAEVLQAGLEQIILGIFGLIAIYTGSRTFAKRPKLV